MQKTNAYSLEWEDEPSSMEGARKGPVPVVVGVTGHLDLDLRAEGAEQGLAEAVRGILTEIQRSAPHTPMVVLSGLAEGADRFVSAIAMREFGARIVCVLPLPQDIYEQDFPKSVNEFREFLAAGGRVDVPFIGGSTREDVAVHGSRRDAQYAEAGAYIVRQAQVLITLWDGGKGGEGGTGYVLDFALSGSLGPFADACSPLDAHGIPPIYRIVTPRISKKGLDGEPFETQILPCDECMERVIDKHFFGLVVRARQSSDTVGRLRVKRFLRVLSRLDRFNADCMHNRDLLTKKATESSRCLIPDSAMTLLPNCASRLRRIYGIADALSIRFRKNQRNALIMLLLASLVAVACFELYAHQVFSYIKLFCFYPAGLAAAYLLYVIAHKREVQNKYLDYRALAEGLRVQLFWRLAGLDREVAKEYLIRHRTELDWIREAIRAWNIPLGEPSATRVDVDPLHNHSRVKLISDHWVEDQRKFFESREERDESWEVGHHLIVRTLFLASIILATAFAAWNWHEGRDTKVAQVQDVAAQGAQQNDGKLNNGEGFSWHHAIVFAIGMLPVFAAAFGAFSEVMAFSAQAQRYRFMADLYSHAADRLRKAMVMGDSEQVRTIIRELGSVALEENGNWVLIHRDHPLEVLF